LSVKLQKQTKDCKSIFVGPLRILGMQVFLGMDGNRKHRNVFRPY